MWRDSASKSFSGKKSKRGGREDRRKKSIGVIRVLFSVLFSLYHQRTINPLNSARPGHVRKTTEGGGMGKKRGPLPCLIIIWWMLSSAPPLEQSITTGIQDRTYAHDLFRIFYVSFFFSLFSPSYPYFWGSVSKDASELQDRICKI